MDFFIEVIQELHFEHQQFQTLPLTRLNRNISKFSNLKKAAFHIQQKHPLLRDRKWMEYDLEEKLNNLSASIASGNYSPTSAAYFFTLNEKTILSATLNCQDYIAQRAIFQILENELTKTNVPNCFFQTKHNKDLLVKCRDWKKQSGWVMVADVKNFFASIRHNLVIKNLEKRCPDSVSLISGFLKKLNEASQHFAKSGTDFQHENRQALPIGIELCYLLASCALHPIDLKMSTLAHTIGYGRYIDDMIFFTEKEEDCEMAYSILQQELASLSLELNHQKTFIQPASVAFRFLREKV